MEQSNMKDTYQDWSERAIKELKGKPLESLFWNNSSGLNFKPYYSAEESVRRFPANVLRNSAEWDVYETIEVKDAKTANRAALEALNAGASALCFSISSAVNLDIAVLLDQIGLPYIQCGFVLPLEEQESFAQALRQWIDQSGFEAGACQGYLQDAAQKRSDGQDLAMAYQKNLALTKQLQTLLPGFRCLVLDACLWANQGMTAEMELALVLSAWHEALEAGFTGKVQVNLGTGREFYTELIKFRVLPHLLSTLAEAYTIPFNTESIYLKAESSEIYLSDLDSYTNLLRLSTAGMSA
ncbi:MAG: methylmalonyl-CoA mutase family protein, partial [Bacteroidota bacterium]|nr:methylmalonyl-CoA mutase family protein [Bacteroidota bacterium]